jgi:hypothetical protein
MLTGCGGTSAAPFNGSNTLPAVTIQISPTAAAVTTGSVQPFTATVSNTGLTTVTWLVNGIVGGNAFVGTIDNNGNYTAPLYVPIPNVVTVTAAANADNSKQANATVTLSGAPLPVKVSAESTNLYFGGITLLTASVALSNPAVVWEVAGVVGGNAAYGTITPLPGNGNQAIYVAPLTSNQSQIPVTAVSVENSQFFASATITLSSPPAGSPVVTLTPANPPTVPAGWAQNFQATVTNTQNTGVTWYVDGIAGGNSSVGTIVPGPDNTAVFTSPVQVPNPNHVYVTATSNAQAEAQATSAVSVVTAPPLKVTVSQNDPCQNPKSVGLGEQLQLVAAVQGAPNQGVTWGVNEVPGGNSTYGTITTNGLYTAPAVIPSNPNVTIDAVSQLDNKTTGTLLLILASQPTMAVSISPTTATVETCPACGDDVVQRNSKYSRKGKKLQPQDQHPQVQTFTATAQFSGANPNYEVAWSVTNNGQDNGAVYSQPPVNGAPPCQSTANYDAPSTVPSPNQIQVTATSEADSQASASATVTIEQGPQYTVTIAPGQPVTLQAGQTQPFNASVRDSDNQLDPNQNFTWTLAATGLDCTASDNPCGTVNPSHGNGQSGNPNCAGNGPCGTLYTAPATVNNNFAVTLTAAPDVDSAAAASAIINLVALPYVAIQPSSVGCPADAGSGTSPDCSDGSPLVSFSVSTNLPATDTVLWQMSCISLNNEYHGSGDECQTDLGKPPGWDGPGCISWKNGTQQCSAEGGFSNVPENDPLIYTPPQNLETGNYSQNACSQGESDYMTNGYLVITATVGTQNICGPNQNQPCSATACIRICPVGSSNCTAP